MKAKSEAIAIVGMGLRLPGKIDHPRVFWKKLLDGFDAIDEIPADRWNKDSYYHPDWTVRTKINTTKGGFIEDVDQFDAEFFRIPPVEAHFVDPQQRILLEVAHHALEDAGITHEKVSSVRCGVFIGATLCDYNTILRHPENVANISAYSSAGATLAILANRLSHVFNLKGPSLTIDTACSSSITALHLAAQSLRSGECEVALVGAVNLILSPETSMSQSKGGFVSPDGHCKAFDGDADGYVRSEGAGVLVVCRESVALQYAANYYASVISTSLNHNGRNLGLSAPSEKAQKELIEKGLEAAGVDARKISYVEAHGTGTVVGDVVEAAAIGKAIGKGRRFPLLMGAVKANIGHIEPGSGLVGLAKLALSLKHETIPPHRLSTGANSRIPFKKYGLALPKKSQKWKSNGRRFAAINSFGFGGSNAFAVVAGEKKKRVVVRDTQESSHLFLLSAHSRQTLIELARSYLGFLADSDLDIRDVCYSTALHKTHFNYRLSIVVSSVDALKSELRAFVEGQHGTYYSRAISPGRKLRVAFVMTGQGGQWPGMAQSLHEIPEFKKIFDGINREWQKKYHVNVREVLASKDDTILHDTRKAQWSLFTLQAALSRFLIRCNIVPEAHIGHSVGEVAAALQSGMITLNDAITLTKIRSELQARFHGRGKMLLVECDADEAVQLCQQHDGDVDVAAFNARNAIVLSGEADALEKIANALRDKSRSVHWLSSSIPFHSRKMKEIAPELLRKTSKLKSQNSAVDFYSSVTGRKEQKLIDQHWVKNLCDAVNFAGAVEQMTLDGINTFIEIGPRPTHIIDINTTTSFHQKPDILVRNILDPKRNDREGLLEVLGTLWANGAKLDLSPIFFREFNFISPPNYVWSKKTYWSETSRARNARIKPKKRHPFLGSAYRTFGAEKFVLKALICDQRIHPFIALKFGATKRLLSPFFLTEGVAAAYKEEFPSGSVSIRDLQLGAPAFLDVDGSLVGVQLELNLKRGIFSIHAAETENSKPLFLASGIVDSVESTDIGLIELSRARQGYGELVDIENTYRNLASSGLDVPNESRALCSVWKDSDSILAHIKLPQKLDFDRAAFDLHPALGEAVWQAADVLLQTEEIRKAKVGLFYPSYIKKMSFFSTAAANIESTDYYAIVKRKPGANPIALDFTIFDSAGRILATVEEMRFEFLENARHTLNPISPTFFVQKWTSTESVADHAKRPFEFCDVVPKTWITFVDNESHFHAMSQQFEREKLRPIKVYRGNSFQKDGESAFFIDSQNLDHFKRILSESGLDVSDYGVLYLWSLQEHTTMKESCTPILHLARAIEELKMSFPRKIVFATSGALCVDPQATHSSTGAGVLALARVIYREYEPVRMTCVDLQNPHMNDERLSLFYELFEKYHQPEVAYRNGRRLALRYEEEKSFTQKEMISFDPHACYLVTGGTAGLGLKIAGWLAKNGVRHLALLSRKGPRSKRDQDEIARLKSSKVRVDLLQCDLTNEDQVEAVIARISQETSLKGVFHAAAVYEDQLMADVTPEAFDSVFNAKALGAYHLHRATYALAMDYFVMISSVTALFGNAGQASYAVANQFLEALVRARRVQGLKGKVINFGPIADAGYLASRDQLVKGLLFQGLRALSIREFEEGLEGALASTRTQSIYCEIDWHRFSRRYPLSLRDHRFRYVMLRQLENESHLEQVDSQLLRKKLLQESDALQRQSSIEETVRQELRRILGVVSENFNVEIPIRDLGLDSLMAMQLRLFISSNLQIDFPYLEVMSSEGPADLAKRILNVFDAFNDRCNARPAP